jgi:hypothetical protein
MYGNDSDGVRKFWKTFILAAITKSTTVDRNMKYWKNFVYEDSYKFILIYVLKSVIANKSSVWSFEKSDAEKQ